MRDWYLENIIMPTLKVADGAWIDGDGPDNGAYQCSGSYKYGQLPAPYPALNETEIAAFCQGEAAVVEAAQKWLIANGGYDYNCLQFVNEPTELPAAGDASQTCVSKMQALAARSAHNPNETVVLYGDRTQGRGYNDSTAAQAVAVFMITRAPQWFFGMPSANSFNMTTARLLLSDFGAPLSNATQQGSMWMRKYANATVTLDCDTFSAAFLDASGRSYGF